MYNYQYAFYLLFRLFLRLHNMPPINDIRFNICKHAHWSHASYILREYWLPPIASACASLAHLRQRTLLYTQRQRGAQYWLRFENVACWVPAQRRLLLISTLFNNAPRILFWAHLALRDADSRMTDVIAAWMLDTSYRHIASHNDIAM